MRSKITRVALLFYLVYCWLFVFFPALHQYRLTHIIILVSSVVLLLLIRYAKNKPED